MIGTAIPYLLESCTAWGRIAYRIDGGIKAFWTFRAPGPDVLSWEEVCKEG